MKKLLISTAILSFALGTQASASSELTLAAPVMTAPAAVTQFAASDLMLRPAAAQPVSVQLVGIGEDRIARPGLRQSAEPSDPRDGQPPAEGLPSTPIALATLLLLLCRLVGRRIS